MDRIEYSIEQKLQFRSLKIYKKKKEKKKGELNFPINKGKYFWYSEYYSIHC